MDLQLVDRVAVGTGSSKGIGLAVTRLRRSEGAKMVVTSRNLSPKPEPMIGTRLVHVPTDLMEFEPHPETSLIARSRR